MYEKKCLKIFTDLEKDLTTWSKYVTQYLHKLSYIYQLEEGVKHNLLKHLDLGSITEQTKQFETQLKKLDEFLNENIKVNCAEILSREELNELKGLEETIESTREQLSVVNETFEGFSKENEKSIYAIEIIQKAKKFSENIEKMGALLTNVQQKIVKNGVARHRIQEN